MTTVMVPVCRGSSQPVEDTRPSSPAIAFADGAFEVGYHIAPGSYRADGPADQLCYWARLSSFGHAGIDGIIANGNSPTVVDISASDVRPDADGVTAKFPSGRARPRTPA